MTFQKIRVNTQRNQHNFVAGGSFISYGHGTGSIITTMVKRFISPKIMTRRELMSLSNRHAHNIHSELDRLPSRV